MTLALLLTAVTGAWAQDPNAVTAAEINSDLYSGWKSDDGKLFKASELPGFQAVTEDQAKSWTGVPSTGIVYLYYKFVADGHVKFVRFEDGVYEGSYEENELERYFIYEDIAYNGDKRYFYTTGPAPTEWSLTPDADKKVWALAKMPANNIELQVEYFAESNLFLSKDALADKANIAVTAGETAVDFGDDGKSANTVTEGTPMTVTYNGTKKVIGVKVEKGGGEPVLLTTITAADNSSFNSGSQTFGDVATVTLTGDYLTNDGSHGGWYCLGSNLTATISVAEANGANITSVKFYTAGGGSAEDKDAPFEVTTTSVTSSNITTYLNGNSIGSYGVSKIEVYGAAEPPIEVTPVAEPAANTKQWTFAMPAFDVVLTPIYAKAAAFATTGTEPDVKTLQPAAAEGVIAGTDASLIAEGTGIVAFAGTSTEDTQGTLMYAIGTSATEAPALTAFSATPPTAENVDDDGADVYVWYYIQGADAPEGQTATVENTFRDSEICSTPLQVNVLSNKFTLTFDPAPVEKVDVTVDGQTATPAQDGKLENVPMGKQVKVTAKTGYKLKKVEVKKGSAAAKTITIGDMELTYADGDKWETIVSKNSDKIKIFSNKIVQLAQPAPNQYRYIHVWYTAVKPSDFIEPSNNYQWDIVEVYF